METKLMVMLAVLFLGLGSGASAADMESKMVAQGLNRHVFYDFDNLSEGGFAVDPEGNWGKAELLSTGEPNAVHKGQGGLEVHLHLKPGQSVRVSKAFQNGDLSMVKAMRLYAKAAKAGLTVRFFTMTNEWKWSDLPEAAMRPGEWIEIQAPFSAIKNLVPQKMNALGLLFTAKNGYDGVAYVDSVDYFASSPYPRDAARAHSSGFEALKATAPVVIAVDGSKAYGVVQPGLIAFNIGDPIAGNAFVSERLREAGPGIMRMWSFGGYHNQMNFNPAEGKYDWAYLDREVRHLLSIGWEPMFCLGEPQKWNTDPKRYVPADFDKWAVMAAEIVRHYNKDLKLGLHNWEIWNEHDIGFWGGTEEEYLKLLAVATREMKKVDPSIRIFAGAWANPGMVKKVGGAMLDKVPPKGLYDGISWHNYIVSAVTPEQKIMQLTPLVEVPAYNAWSILRARGLDSGMAVGMTEANINPSAETDWRYEGMLGGVYWASELVHFILQNCSLAVFFTATGDDNYAALTDRAKPSYQSILLFAKHAKVVGKQWLKTSYPEVNANLETLALADDKEFSLLAVNKDTRGTAFKARYKLSNLPALDGPLHAWGIRDGHLEATDLGMVPVSQGEINVTFPPFSVTVLTGRFQKPRKAVVLLKAEPSSASQGLAVLGQYSWNGLPAKIAKAPSGLRLNADLAAFSGVPAIQLDGKDPAKVVGAKLGSANELRASLRLMRDDKNLYLAC
ncbi:MAG: hypothetical protein V4498_02005, partial [candidate division FCPU426 bacterium]